MIFVYLGLFFAEWFAFVVLFLPFGVLALAELVRAAKLPGMEGVPSDDPPGARMTRWHVVAAFLLIGSMLLTPLPIACAFLSGSRCVVGSWYLIAIEATLWFMTLSILFGPMYAVRLHRQRVHAAELIGLGVCLFPATLWIGVAAINNGDSQLLSASGAAGAALFLLGLAIPFRWVKTLVLAMSCVMMLLALAEFSGPSISVWLLTAIAMGYTVFRAEWKLSAWEPSALVQTSSQEAAASDSADMSRRGRWRDGTVRIASFLAVNAVCAAALFLISRVGFGAEGSPPATVYALAGLAIAAVGALLTALAPAAFGRPDHVAAMFVTILTAAAVLHILAAPRVMGFDQSTTAFVQLWKPVLVAVACSGALAIAFTTLTGKLRQIRPFMIVIVLPAAFLLPSDSFFTFGPGDSAIAWAQRALETGITVTMLAIMWYIFGPGRRRARSPAPERDVRHGPLAEAAESSGVQVLHAGTSHHGRTDAPIKDDESPQRTVAASGGHSTRSDATCE